MQQQSIHTKQCEKLISHYNEVSILNVPSHPDRSILRPVLINKLENP